MGYGCSDPKASGYISVTNMNYKPNFQEERTTQMAAHVLKLNGRKMNVLKLIKLLYLIDREAFIRWGHPISYDWFVSMPHGPVGSFTLDALNNAQENDYRIWHRYISERTTYDVTLLADAPTDKLSEAEIQLIEEMHSRYGSMSEWELRDFTHGLPEWTDPKGSSQSIDIEIVLRDGNHTEEDIREIESALEARRQSQALFS